MRERSNEQIDLTPERFRELGHKLVDRIARFYEELPSMPVTRGHAPSEVRELIGGAGLPEKGTDLDGLVDEAAELVFQHALHNAHPRFWGYINPSASPFGTLAEFLASAANPNVGAWELAPVATEIEKQAISWIAELLGYPTDCGGILVSGGNMANYLGMWCARRHVLGEEFRSAGVGGSARAAFYGSTETHMWIMKAADLFGFGTESVRWIAVDADRRMNVEALREAIARDVADDITPVMVVAAAGTVATGAVDPIAEISAVCREHGAWLHVDGAYGAPAAVLPDAPAGLEAMHLADSIATDPHKWLYTPLEAGCTLVRDPELMRQTFSYHPSYYKFGTMKGERADALVDFGPQNSRGFRALKVWMGLRQLGREGHARSIAEDIALARHMFEVVDADPEFEAFTNGLSITTFRYVPEDREVAGNDDYLNELNTEVITRLQEGGEAFFSNAVIDGKYVLRACIVNFRTTKADVEAAIESVRRLGREVHAAKQ